MCRNRMDDEEKVRILAWRQKNLTTKKSTGILKGQGHLCWSCWLLLVTYIKMSFLLPNLDLDHDRRHPNTDDLLIRELRKNHQLSASKLKEMHPDHFGNVSVSCIQHSLQ